MFRIHLHAPASIVDDLLHNTLDVAIALREVKGAELRRGLVVVGVGFELLRQPILLNIPSKNEGEEHTIA